MADNVYECMFILNSNRYARDPSGVSEQVNKIIEDSQAEVLASILWNEQKLAYPISGHRKGTYWLTYFRMESDLLAAFNRACQLNDTVLRSLALKVDPRLVETLVGHATGKRAGATEATKSETKTTTTPAATTPAATTPAATTPADATPADATPTDATPTDATPADAAENGGS